MAMFYFLAFIGVFVLANYLVPLIVRRRQLIQAVKNDGGFLCLTFDDGPDSVLTNSLMKLLEEKKAKATFFLVGFRSERHPEVCRALLKAEHEIACHTYSHGPQWKQFPWKALEDVRKGYAVMEQWISPGSPFRPPRGKIQFLPMAWLMANRIKVLWWTHDSGDTHPKLPDSQKIVEKLRSSRGGVILLHSRHEDLRRQDYVLKLTDSLIDMARGENLTICTASEYMNAIRKKRAK